MKPFRAMRCPTGKTLRGRLSPFDLQCIVLAMLTWLATTAFGESMAEAQEKLQPAPWARDFLPPPSPWHGASEKLVAAPRDLWITPAERSAFTESPSYAATRDFVERLIRASPLLLSEVYFGTSPEGRKLIAVLAAKDRRPDGTPDPAKPLLLVQAGIHPGEIDGKDAGLMLLRDIVVHGKDKLLDRANLLFVPILNVDGHERVGRFNRPNQRGPKEQGWRSNAQNLNLNRDYGKLDTAEIRGIVSLINSYNPDLYLDLHVTDGMDYQYDITFGNSATESGLGFSPHIGNWLANSYRPAVDAALTAAGHVPGPLVFEVDTRQPQLGLSNNVDSARYSTGYGDIVHLPTVLVENHALKPYRQRVLGTYVLLEETLALLGRDGARLRQAKSDDAAFHPNKLTIDWKREKSPSDRVQFKTMEYETSSSVASGSTEVRWLGRPAGTVSMPVFKPMATIKVQLPVAYWVPASRQEIIERLVLHGIQIERITSPRILVLEYTRLHDPKPADECDGSAALTCEGHIGLNSEEYSHEWRRATMPLGSVRVTTDQKLGNLAAILLEAESPEGFLAWGYFPEIFQRTEYVEPYVMAPLADSMLAACPALKEEFEKKLAAEPKFAGDPDKRLEWFYERTPYYDSTYLLYPIARELSHPPAAADEKVLKPGETPTLVEILQSCRWPRG